MDADLDTLATGQFRRFPSVELGECPGGCDRRAALMVGFQPPRVSYFSRLGEDPVRASRPTPRCRSSRGEGRDRGRSPRK